MWESPAWKGHDSDFTRSLILPMYQERARIGRTFERLAGSAVDGVGVEFLFVDDGSSDGTYEAVEALCDEYELRGRIVQLPENQGKGAAIAAGVAAACGEVIVFTDADLSTSIADIVACFTTIEAEQADVVVASRAHPESVIEADGPVRRQIIGRVYNRLLRLLGLTTLRDTQCGLKGFRADAARALFADLRVPGFGFDIEVLAKAQRHHLVIEELPVQWDYVAQSRVRPVRDSIRMGRDALTIRRTVRATARPATQRTASGDQVASS